MNHTYTIVIRTGDSCVPQALTALMSVQKTLKPGESAAYYLLAEKLSEASRAAFLCLKEQPYSLDVSLIEAGGTELSRLARLPELLPDAGRALVLTSDVLVQKELSALFAWALQGKALAAVRHPGPMLGEKPGKGSPKHWIDDGVLLMDLAFMRGKKIGERILKAEAGTELEVLNQVLDGMAAFLPMSYDLHIDWLAAHAKRFDMPQLNVYGNVRFPSLQGACAEAHILRFCSGKKPWESMEAYGRAAWDAIYAETPKPAVLKRTARAYPAEEIPVVFASDAGYMKQTLIAIVSIMENSGANYAFYILTQDDLDPAMFAFIHERYPNGRITPMKIGSEFDSASLTISHITAATYFRLKIPDLFQDVDKLIYLDGDIAVDGDLYDLYAQDLGACCLAGVKAPYFTVKTPEERKSRDARLPLMPNYVNAGVLVMNLAAIRAGGIQKKWMEMAKEAYLAQDQDILNGSCSGAILPLPYVFNCQAPKYDVTMESRCIAEKAIPAAERNEGTNLPVIIHYCDKQKPWNNPCVPLADRWWHYAAMTPFYEHFHAVAVAGMLQNSTVARADITIALRRRASMEAQLQEIKQSRAYRIGSKIMAILGKLKGK